MDKQRIPTGMGRWASESGTTQAWKEQKQHPIPCRTCSTLLVYQTANDNLSDIKREKTNYVNNLNIINKDTQI